MSKLDSAGLRQQLEDHLTFIFANQTIGKYLLIDGCGPDLQLISNFEDPILVLPKVKLAYSIWTLMDVLDRHNVLGKFHELYAALPILNGGNRKTLVFCALFVNEFATILAEAMEWPN